jgi:hypothetical protein
VITIFSMQGYLLSFLQFSQNKRTSKENEQIRGAKSHTLAGYPSNCTTVRYKLPDAQNQTHPYYAIANSSGCQDLTEV